MLKVIIEFKNLKFKKLWEMALVGQLSDGHWEDDSDKTEWLWDNTEIRMGEKNIIYVPPGVTIGRKWIDFYESLDHMHELMVKAGDFEDQEEMRKACHHIRNMCRYPTVLEQEEPAAKKPECKLTGTDGNVYSIIGNVQKALRKAGLGTRATEYGRKALQQGSYDEVITLAHDYVQVS